jgi:hypothetical protein
MLPQCEECIYKISIGDLRGALRLAYRLLLLNGDALALHGPPEVLLPAPEALHCVATQRCALAWYLSLLAEVGACVLCENLRRGGGRGGAERHHQGLPAYCACCVTTFGGCHARCLCSVRHPRLRLYCEVSFQGVSIPQQHAYPQQHVPWMHAAHEP